MLIAIATDSWEPLVNGVATTLNMMVRMLSNDGHIVMVIHPWQYNYISCPKYPDIKLAYNIKLPEHFLSKCDAIHIATEGPIGLAVRKWCKKNNKMYNTSYHTNFPDYLKKYYGIPSWITYKFIKSFHSSSKKILVPTNTTKIKLKDKGFKNLDVWGRGYDEKIFHPNYDNVLFSNKIKLLCVIRISHEKNLEEYCKLSYNPEYELWLVGDGPARKKLEKQFPLVHFTGIKRGKELAAYYASADVFVFPSKTDTLGVVMIESMACGTPVVAYPVEGPIDVLFGGGIFTKNLDAGIKPAMNISKKAISDNLLHHTWSKSYQKFLSSLLILSQE